MKKLLAGVLALLLLLAGCAQTGPTPTETPTPTPTPSPSERVPAPGDDMSRVSQAVAAYFAYRNAAIGGDGAADAPASDRLCADAAQRASAMRAYWEEDGVYILSAETEATIKEVHFRENGTVTAAVYEAVDLTYNFKGPEAPAEKDKMGYGIMHVLTLSAGDYLVVGDAYDDTLISNHVSEDYDRNRDPYRCTGGVEGDLPSAPEVPDSLRAVGDVDGDGVQETLVFGGFDKFGTTGSLWVDGEKVLTLESEGAFDEGTCRLAAANLDDDGRSEVLVLLDVPARSGSVPFRLLKLTDGVWQERTAPLPHLTLTLSDGWTATLTDGSQTWTEEVTNPEVRAAWFDENGAPTAEDVEAWTYADRTEFYILEGTVRFTAHAAALNRAAAGREGEPALDRTVTVRAAVEDGQIVLDDSLAETVLAWLADPAPELAAARDLIDGDRWLSAALSCIFDDPKDLDLGLLFREGFYGLPGGGEASEEERDYLKQQGLEFDCPVQRLPVSLLNEVLERYFGVTLDDVAVPEDWYWRADTGCYYSFYSDFYGVALWAPLKVERTGGDLIVTYVPYPWQAIPNPKTGEPVTAAVMTLREQEEGGWLVVSNVNRSE